MRVAITGASGLIGQGVIKELSGNDFNLTCLSRQQRQMDNQNGIKWLNGDLAIDGVAEQILNNQDVVLHLAHETTPLSVAADSMSGLKAGIWPTLKLISAAKKCTHTPHIIYLSSGGAIYGESFIAEQPCRESDRCEPLTEYGIQKLVIERYLHSAAMTGSLRCTILRVSNAYGSLLNPDRTQGLIGTSVARITQGLPLRLIGNPDNVRDYIHVKDIALALKQSLRHSEAFDIFNIGSGVGYSVREVMDIILKLGGSNSPIEIQNVYGSNLLASRNVLDITKARRELSWTPTISLETGIRAMLSDELAK